MEASLSSGSDGFGPVSTGMILSFLNRVTCVHVQSASGTPTAGSPSNRPPTSPSPPSTPSSVIGCRTKAAVQSPSCIVTGSNKYDFACYKLTEILPPYCSFKQLRFVVHTCDGFSLGRRELHRTSSDVAKPVHAVNATVVGGSFSNETGFVQEQSSSSTFQASNCKKSCILSSSSVCFVGSSSHVITFIALDKSGHQVDRVFERTIALNTNSGNSCRSANVKCVN